MAEGVELPERGLANLAKAFELLSQAPPQRWLSLTYKMGCNPDENLVHAMSLILLKRHGEAHAKLSANGDSNVGKYLAEMIKMHGERLNGDHIRGFNERDIKTLLDIARIFAIFVKESLCDKSLRDQAYHEALASSRTAGLQSLDVEEEVKQVCGPDVIAKSNTELATEMYLTSLDATVRNISQPSSHQSNSTSYSIEISTPTVKKSNADESMPLSLHTPTDSKNQDQLRSSFAKSTNICPSNQPQPSSVNNTTNSTQCLDHNVTSQLPTSKTTNSFSSPKAQPINANERKPPTEANSFRSTDSNQCDVDETFYAFVILHEAEDADEALRLRDELERITSGTGATFSDDFAQPGRSMLRCVEDAIENSAFTLLLLTQNFKSNLSMTSADSAIVNSLENHHKFNSVIPLLPRKNRLPRERLPLVLQTKVALDERSRAFERNASKAIAPAAVAKHKTIWISKQRIKKFEEEQRNRQEEYAINERLARLRLEREMQQNMFYAQSAAYHPAPSHGMMHAQHDSWQQQPSCIHIENAQNVMIGNHSTMNIEHAKSSADELNS